MRTALIVIDMLNDFMDGVLGNPAAEQLVGPIASLAERARGSHEWVVVYANDAHQLNDVELRVFPPMPWPERRGPPWLTSCDHVQTT